MENETTFLLNHDASARAQTFFQIKHGLHVLVLFLRIRQNFVYENKRQWFTFRKGRELFAAFLYTWLLGGARRKESPAEQFRPFFISNNETILSTNTPAGHPLLGWHRLLCL